CITNVLRYQEIDGRYATIPRNRWQMCYITNECITNMLRYQEIDGRCATIPTNASQMCYDTKKCMADVLRYQHIHSRCATIPTHASRYQHNFRRRRFRFVCFWSLRFMMIGLRPDNINT